MLFNEGLELLQASGDLLALTPGRPLHSAPAPRNKRHQLSNHHGLAISLEDTILPPV